MTTDARSVARQAALDRIDDLLDVLRNQPDSARIGELREIAGHLKRAVEAFHMEGIRFRYFTLARLLAQETPQSPPRARVILDEVGAALEGAGFRIK